MDFPVHQIGYRRVHEAMTLNRGFASESAGYNVGSEMAALARASVAGMGGAVVHDFQMLGFQRGPQPLLDQGGPVAHAGSTLRNG